MLVLRWLSVTWLSVLATSAGTSSVEPNECDASVDNNDLSCAATAADDKDDQLASSEARGGDFDPLTSRIAVVSGQIPIPPVCGTWCKTPTTVAQDLSVTPCTIDKALVPCETDFGCTTTCAMWIEYTQKPKDGEKRPVVQCPQFSAMSAYTSHAGPCDESCLLPEIRKERYPLPTGLGLFCERDTCNPFVSSQNPNSPAILECPCNFFGSDCADAWVPIQSLNHTGVHGSSNSNALMSTTLTVSPGLWEKVVAGHRPGGVIRIVQRDTEAGVVMAEQPYALAYASKERGTLEIVTAPPDKRLHPFTRQVAERVRALPSGPIQGGNLFVNPTIVGFFNKQWTFLLDAIEQSQQQAAGVHKIENLVVLATGSGLSGALSAVEAVLQLKQGFNGRVHLYYGLRNVQHLPYRERLNELAASDDLDLALLESSNESDQEPPIEPGLTKALRRGKKVRELSPASSFAPFLGNAQKVYVQQALGLEMTSEAGVLKAKDADLNNTAFAVCGRLELLTETYSMLRSLLCTKPGTEQECESLLGTRFFTNI